VFDTYTSALHYATAGHLPPVVISGGEARVLEVTPAPPLGAFPYGRCPEHELSLESGEILLLYTDGLVERRGVPLSTGIEALAKAVRDATTPEDACASAIADLVPVVGLNDDVAIVSLQSAIVPNELHLTLPAEPRTLSHVRRVLRRWLNERGADDGDIAEMTIAVSEACANAIEHAYAPSPATFELHGWANNGNITVTVRDDGHWRPPRGHNRGRGLSIIVAAMDDVQIDRTADGTEVVMRRHITGK
jgi:anti-sigma regulatory factor (Ser/Thr protein kinase)